MEDLLQSQIRDSCRLALPEGLKDLMADISREVLRAQPQNLYQFIADYLSVLLVAREHLFVASRVCDDLCKDQCWRDLEDELRRLSLSEEDVTETLKVVEKYFSSDGVNEGSLLQKLTQKTNLEQNELPAVQEAIRSAFLRHRLNCTAPVESPSADSELDETTIAAKHTLKIYQKATEDDPDVNYDCVASKIQTAYRAYNVRRKREESPTPFRKSNEKVRFVDKQERLTADLFKQCASKCSSMSLAGSFVALPLYHPYTVATEQHDHGEVDEIGDKERERVNIDYVADAAAREQQGVNGVEKKGSKMISFHSLPKVVEVDYCEVEDEADEADYDSEEIAEDVMINVSGNDLDEQDNDDDLAKTDSVVISELPGDESDLSESSLEENDDGRNLQQSEMDRITNLTGAQHAHDVQAHSLSFAEDILDSMPVNTDESDEQYKRTSFEITPDDNMTLQFLRAVSDEIEDLTNSQNYE